MSKAKVQFACAQCGWVSPKWGGQCRECGAWGTLEEQSAELAGQGFQVSVAATAAAPVTSIDIETAQAFPSGISEFDRVLGRGITPGGVILLAGEPGVGKSTLLLDIAARFARMNSARGPVLYATGEESEAQVRLRAERIGALTDDLWLAADNNVDAIVSHFETTRPSLLILDSVQTFSTSDADGAIGGVNQIKGVTSRIIQAAKSSGTPVILVGHVTKDGALAGPRTLEHLVDVVCQFEGDRHTSLRMLRAIKNRYGSTDEVGCFQLTDHGIEEIPDPSALFVSPYLDDVPGTCTTVTLEGNRPLMVEIQALVVPSGGGNGRRTVSGVDHARVAMVLAVLHAHLNIELADHDVYVSAVGGARASSPSVDLAIAVAIYSAVTKKALSSKLVALGEVGLTGDVRGCTGLARRLQEARRLGYSTALISGSQSDYIQDDSPLQVIPVRTVEEATRAYLR
jgi:DNA repair protein RadA